MIPAPGDAALTAARQMAGQGARITAVEPLSGGTANRGLRLYHLSDGQAFVEKRTTSRREYQIAVAALAGQRQGTEPCSVMLRFLHVAEDEGAYLIYSERLAGVGGNDDWLWDREEDLARSVHALGLCLERMNIDHPPEPGTPDTLSRLRAALGDAGGGENVAAISAAFEAARPVMGHNDVFWPNMGNGRAPGCFTFLDFALVGPNLPGAEFHHFAQRAGKSDRHNAFFQTVTAHYARLLGAPAGLVRGGAYAYAALRALSRARRKQQEEAGRRTALALLERAEVALQVAA